MIAHAVFFIALVGSCFLGYMLGAFFVNRYHAFTPTAKQLPPIGKRVLLKRKTVPVYVMGARISTDKWTDDLCHATPPRDASEIEAWKDVL